VAIVRRIDVISSKERIETVRNDYPNLTRWGFWPNAQDSFEAARAEMTSNGANRGIRTRIPIFNATLRAPPIMLELRVLENHDA
jgi:hypothetical protein